MNRKTDGERYSEQETIARREAALKRMLNTPHKPHKATKLRKKRKKSKAKDD
jgi:hypothetical protein